MSSHKVYSTTDHSEFNIDHEICPRTKCCCLALLLRYENQAIEE